MPHCGIPARKCLWIQCGATGYAVSVLLEACDLGHPDIRISSGLGSGRTECLQNRGNCTPSANVKNAGSALLESGPDSGCLLRGSRALAGQLPVYALCIPIECSIKRASISRCVSARYASRWASQQNGIRRRITLRTIGTTPSQNRHFIGFA